MQAPAETDTDTGTGADSGLVARTDSPAANR